MVLEQIRNSLILEKGEKLLKAWEGDVESTVKTVQSRRVMMRTKHRVVEAKDGENGTLALTNERLIWLRKRGTFSKSYHQSFEIPLEEITGISETGTFGKRICVSDREGEFRFRIGVALPDFRNAVQAALAQRKEALEEMRKKEECISCLTSHLWRII